MNFLILVSTLLAAASAGWAPSQLSIHHVQPQHVPVIHNGVPVETPEVQHAKQAHYAALAEAVAHPEYQHAEEPEYHHHYSVPQTVHYAAPVSYSAQPISHHHHQAPVTYTSKHITPAYETSHVLPAIGHNGKPLDTPEVEAAKAHHFAAVQKALSAVATHGPQIHYHHKRDAHWALQQHVPVINHHGVPDDTAEVKLARHEHLAAHGAVHSGTFGYGIHQAHYPVYGTHDYHIPKFDHKGFQLDTADVELAKAAHFAAHQEANARLAHHSYGNHWDSGITGHYHY